MSALNRAQVGRLVAGAVVIAATIVGVGALVAVDLPGHTRDTISLEAQPPASASTAVCTGPLLAIGRDSTQAALLTDAGAQTVTAAAEDAASVEAATLAAVSVSGGAGPAVLTAAPDGGEPTDLAAAGSSRIDAPDLSGFAAAPCTRPAMESWLVGGAATTGAADLVILANPGDVPASVDLVVYGATGRTTPAAGADLVVAAGSQRVVPLAALALGEESPVVQVTATQAPVQASLQASITRVLVPGGVDQIAAGSAPTAQLTIPGVPIALAPADPGASDVPATLRLLAPTADGSATVTVIGPSGVASEPQVVPLVAGVPLQLDLDGLSVGTYTVSVSATTPITGAVWSTTGFGAGSDFGWFGAADALTSGTLVAVADGSSPTLTLASDGAAAESVTVTSGAGAGEAREVSVAAGGTAEVEVQPGELYLIEPGPSGIHAAISYAAAGGLAGYPVQAGDAAAAAITVYPR